MVSLTIIIIGAINLNQAIQETHSLVKSAEHMSENTLDDFSKIQDNVGLQDNFNYFSDQDQELFSQSMSAASSFYLGFGIFTGVFVSHLGKKVTL